MHTFYVNVISVHFVGSYYIGSFEPVYVWMTQMLQRALGLC